MAVLFSPVGDADRTGLDFENEGAVLHILRNYPDIDSAVLYLSADQVERHNKDPFDAYIDLVRPDLTREYIKRPQLTDPHHFDTAFYGDFSSAFSDISEKHSGQTVYVNLSSGTPAMKSALLVLVELGSHRITPLQVDHPKYASGVRVHEVPTENFRKLITIESVKKLVEKYDYPGARSLAKDVLEDDRMALIDGLVDRYELRTGAARKKLGFMANEYIGSCTQIGKTFEYLQYLEVLYEKGDWASYLRATDPAVVNVLLQVVDTFTEYSREHLVKTEGTATLNVDIVSKNQVLSKIFAQDLLKIEQNVSRGKSKDIFLTWYPLRELIKESAEGLDPALFAMLRDSTLDSLQNERNKFVHSYQMIVAVNAKQQADRWKGFLYPLLEAAAIKKNEKLPARDSYGKLNKAIIAML